MIGYCPFTVHETTQKTMVCPIITIGELIFKKYGINYNNFEVYTVFPRSNAAATNFFLLLKLAAIIQGRRQKLILNNNKFSLASPTLAGQTIIILILHLSVGDVHESGRSREAIRPELKRFLSLHQWTWSRHEVVH